MLNHLSASALGNTLSKKSIVTAAQAAPVISRRPFSRAKRTLATVASLVAVDCFGTVHANEGLTPYLPAISTGAPVAVLPEPGFYAASNFFVPYGKVVDGSGRKSPVTIVNYTGDLTLVWSTPFHLLGAHYGVGLTQIGAVHSVDATRVGGRRTSTLGAFNTILQPVVLSWKVGADLYVSTAQSVYLKDGRYSATRGITDQTSYANNTYTYEPSVALSFLPKGLNLTANLIYDTSSTNHRTRYRSGDTVYADLTAERIAGGTSYGLVANVTQQVEDDRRFGSVVGNGQRVSHLMAGPIVSHTFGRLSVTLRYLQDIRSRNDVGLSIGFLTLSTKL